jgi:hypothetical protein
MARRKGSAATLSTPRGDVAPYAPGGGWPAVRGCVYAPAAGIVAAVTGPTAGCASGMCGHGAARPQMLQSLRISVHGTPSACASAQGTPSPGVAGASELKVDLIVIPSVRRGLPVNRLMVS